MVSDEEDYDDDDDDEPTEEVRNCETSAQIFVIEREAKTFK